LPVTHSGHPPLFQSIGYDPELEASAFRQLAGGDVAGCRRALAALVEGLDLGALEGRGRLVEQLLVDILQKVNRRVHRGPDAQSTYQATRVGLIEEFAGCDGAEVARERFRGALAGLMQPLERRARPPHPLVEQSKTYIESNYHRRVSLSAVAERMNVSANYLSRVFRREAGMTLTAYIQRVRLEHARLLLADGGQSISEIAYRVGYRNYRDFYRNFVKYENASPRQVRRRLSRAG
jgi:AraC-like DNA-binding protein